MQKNVKTTYLNLDSRITIETYEFKTEHSKKWIKMSDFKIGEESYSKCYFGDSIDSIKIRKDEICFIVKSEDLESYEEMDSNYALYRPTSNLINEIRNILGIFIKGLKITVEIH